MFPAASLPRGFLGKQFHNKIGSRQMSSKLSLSFACGGYDRMDALRYGEVQPLGVNLNFLNINNPRDLFDRTMAHEFDASEMSASEYICAFTAGKRNYVAIPVFPSRTFRHGYIAVDTNQVKSPKDLEGKKVGVQRYTMTAAVWIRGLLAQAGVNLDRITWIEGSLESPGSHGQPASFQLSKSVNICQNGDSARGLSQLLACGEIAATIGADLPSSFGKAPNVKRLFPNHKQVEIDYYRNYGIFPIMHLVVIKRSLVENDLWLPSSLFEACTRSRDLALKRMRYRGSLRYMLPWMEDGVEEIDEVFGDDFWAYGLEKNKSTLDALVNFLHDQKMIDWKPSLEELFWPVKQGQWQL